MNCYSQCGEDVWILEHLKPAIGTFCEVGAFDGLLSSNTLLFEQQGWTGFLVEADPFLAAKCQVNRSCPTWCCAVGKNGLSRSGFSINEADRGLSGFRRPGKPVPMVSVPLSDLIKASGFHHLDLLSIDTEGTEIDVWESIGAIRPGIVIMEYQTCQEPPQLNQINARMAMDGYITAHQTTYNLIFTRP